MNQYQHNCDQCQFLGTDHLNGNIVDIYICLENIPGPSIIIRHSDEPSNYSSYPTFFLNNMPPGPDEDPLFLLAAKWMLHYFS